jgi:hypothetical protein
MIIKLELTNPVPGQTNNVHFAISKHRAPTISLPVKPYGRKADEGAAPNQFPSMGRMMVATRDQEQRISLSATTSTAEVSYYAFFVFRLVR